MKIIIYFSLLVSFLLSAPDVLAQTATPSVVKQATPTATAKVVFTKSINSLLNRFKAAVAREEKIAQRISLRLTKLRPLPQASTANIVLSKLDTQRETLLDQLSKVNAELIKLDLQSQGLSTATPSRNDYLLFKNQALIFIKNLKDIHKMELDLVVDLKKLATTSPTPSIKVIPTQ